MNKGILYINLCVFLLGGTAILAKTIPLPIETVIFMRSLVVSIFLFIFFKFTRVKILLDKPKDYLHLFFLGALLAAHWYTYFYALKTTTIAIGIISFFTYPLFTVLYEPLFTGSKYHLKDFILSGLSFFGVYLLIPEGNWSGEFVLGVSSGVVSANFFAIRNVLSKKFVKAYPPNLVLFYQILSTLLIYSFFVSYEPKIIETKTALELLILGTVFTALPHGFYLSSLQYLKAKSVSIFSTLQIFWGAVFAYIILGENVESGTLLGASIVIFSSIMEVYWKDPSPKDAT